MRGGLSRLALHRMHDYATGESVPLDTVDAGPSTADGPGDPLHHHTSIPEELETIHHKIRKGEPLTPEESGFLKQNYVHESANEGDVYEAMSPTINRIIYPNK